jgi:hypothetical protein
MSRASSKFSRAHASILGLCLLRGLRRVRERAPSPVRGWTGPQEVTHGLFCILGAQLKDDRVPKLVEVDLCHVDQEAADVHLNVRVERLCLKGFHCLVTGHAATPTRQDHQSGKLLEAPGSWHQEPVGTAPEARSRSNLYTGTSGVPFGAGERDAADRAELRHVPQGKTPCQEPDRQRADHDDSESHAVSLRAAADPTTKV